MLSFLSGGFNLDIFVFYSPVPSNRKPAKRLRFEKEEQRRERALTYKISRSKRYIACSDVVEARGVEPLSESTSTDLSPGADGYLDSLARA